MTKRTKHPLAGKTRIAAKAARKAGIPVVDIPLAKVDPSDTRGFLVPRTAEEIREGFPTFIANRTPQISHTNWKRARAEWNLVCHRQVEAWILHCNSLYTHKWTAEREMPRRNGEWWGEAVE